MSFAHSPRFQPGATVLDVGATESLVALSLASLGYEVTAVDPAAVPVRAPDLTSVAARIEDWEHERHVRCASSASRRSSTSAWAHTAKRRRTIAPTSRRCSRMHELIEPGGLLVLTTRFGTAGGRRVPAHLRPGRGSTSCSRAGRRGADDPAARRRDELGARRRIGRRGRRRREGRPRHRHARRRVSAYFDIQGIQSAAHGERGIARYLTELARALERWHPDVRRPLPARPASRGPGLDRAARRFGPARVHGPGERRRGDRLSRRLPVRVHAARTDLAPLGPSLRPAARGHPLRPDPACSFPRSISRSPR